MEDYLSMEKGVKISIPNDITVTLNEMGIYNIEQFVIKLLEDVIRDKKLDIFTDEELNNIETHLQSLGHI